jgi:hypothetical protein
MVFQIARRVSAGVDLGAGAAAEGMGDLRIVRP